MTSSNESSSSSSLHTAQSESQNGGGSSSEAPPRENNGNDDAGQANERFNRHVQNTMNFVEQRAALLQALQAAMPPTFQTAPLVNTNNNPQPRFLPMTEAYLDAEDEDEDEGGDAGIEPWPQNNVQLDDIQDEDTDAFDDTEGEDAEVMENTENQSNKGKFYKFTPATERSVAEMFFSHNESELRARKENLEAVIKELRGDDDLILKSGLAKIAGGDQRDRSNFYRAKRLIQETENYEALKEDCETAIWHVLDDQKESTEEAARILWRNNQQIQRENTDQLPVDQSPTPIQEARKIICAGASFKGRIKLPESTDGDDYLLTILGEDKDTGEMIGIHAAYSDEQVVFVKFTETSDSNAVRIQYEDIETHIDGLLDLTTKEITGEVKQLVSGDNNIFVPTDSASHVFNLKAEDNDDINTLRRQVITLHREAAPLIFARLRSKLTKHKPNFWSQLGDHHLHFSQIQVMELNSRMRRYDRNFEKEEFETTEDKRIFVRSMRRVIQPHAAHLAISTVLQRWQSTQGERSRGTNTPLGMTQTTRYLWWQQRIYIAINRLSSVSTNVRERVPQQMLFEFNQILSQAEPIQCSICIEDCLTGEKHVRLPCNHWYHKDCAEQWFQTRNSCPVCREQICEAIDEDED